MTTPPLLLASDLHKAYNGKPALKGVGLSLQAGEMCALLGPNGAGKSTLLQLLTGLFNPDQGQITVLGHDMQTQPALALRGLGVVFQQSALDMDLPVLSNLLFHTDLHGIPRRTARARIDEGLAAMGLTDQGRAVVRSLSGGTRRKVELVRALLHQPQVLLMDEATVGLDPGSRQQLLDTVRGLCRERGMAVLWATHLIEEAQMADRLLLLHEGAARFDGSVDAFMQAAQGSDFQTEVLRQLEKKGL
ncbi:ABC transporter ATP-binding protein [Hydrogenophaga crassostreae]|uniref:ABC transporter ATP-binding protein n=1 Tax=Hydrogenophaga crassostreae TaxID=1763535 RepID=A0A162PEM0_9BURK|nr:ATP-binding cassette domain-containing protein [Hydrogenophaga crassostreae]AOW13751.1 ABC transporter ATP-binding protein [Hydrogenophaga crassostreae]OAD44287.1 ABC transporter ATP-binding protein [Hydrogenophaga crassostreae]